MLNQQRIPTFDKLKVLLTHPENDKANEISNFLNTMNCKPDIVNSAQESFTQMHKYVGSPKMYDIVIVNYILPDSNGELFANMLKSDKFLNTTKMIIINNNDYTLKPIELEKLGVFAVILYNDMNGLKNQILKIATIKKHKADSKVKQKVIQKQKSRILLVEDNPINQKVAGLNLTKMNYDFDIASNGKVAVDKYIENPYPIIIMDIQMPIMDGFEATNHIRQFEARNNLKPSVIIALTANAMRGDREKYLEAGMDEYLSKPFIPAELKKILQEIEELI